MTVKEKRKELLRLDDRDLVGRILAFPDREKLNRDDEGKRRKYPSAEMALRARRSMEKDPDYRISEKQRFAMCNSFAENSNDMLKIVGIKFAAADPSALEKKQIKREGVKTTYDMTFHLEPEPENEHDKNAVAVYVNNEQDPSTRTRIGYLPAAYVAEHPIFEPMSVKGTLTDHSNGTFKTISYVADMDTEHLEEKLQEKYGKVAWADQFVYRMPFLLNGEAQENAGEYLNNQTWTSADGRQNGWAERLNDELEYWGVNGRVDEVYFEFPGGNRGEVVVTSPIRLNDEAMGVCGSYFRYSLETGISSDLRREGLVKAPANLPAVDARKKMYFSLQAEQADDFTQALAAMNKDDSMTV